MHCNFRQNTTVEDNENNNVDENSNDHQYIQYASYHTQFPNQEIRNLNSDNISQMTLNQTHPHLRSQIDAFHSQLQHRNDEVDSTVNFRRSEISNSLPPNSERNSRRESAINYNLPPLPSNRENSKCYSFYILIAPTLQKA